MIAAAVALLGAGTPTLMRGQRGGIRFFPDGSATGGRISLVADAKRFEVRVDWFDGSVLVEEGRADRSVRSENPRDDAEPDVERGRPCALCGLADSCKGVRLRERRSDRRRGREDPMVSDGRRSSEPRTFVGRGATR